MTVSGITAAALGQSIISVTGTGTPATVTQSTDVALNVFSSTISATLVTPLDAATGVMLTDALTWNVDANASSYDVTIYDDAGLEQVYS